jgi:opacity protein-like surface antigen
VSLLRKGSHGAACALVLVAATQANAQSIWHNFEISAAGGADWYSVADTEVEISFFETDSIFVNEIETAGTWKVGLGYFIVPNLLAETNVYQTFTTLSGNVWQYELPQFNNYTYQAPITSTRWMFELKPNAGTYGKITPYAILGVGVSWNTVSYRETPIDDVRADSVMKLSDNTTAQLAWDLGLGFSVEATKHFDIFAEYIYAFLGEGSPSSTSSSDARLTEAPNFSLQVQTFLVGFSYQF